MLYNFPAMTGQDVSPALVKRLAGQYPALVGIKETVDSLSHIRSMITEVKSVRPDFAVMCGYDEYLLATLAAGGDGAIAASANFAPELLLGIYNSFRDGDFTSLMDYQHRIMAIPELYEMVLPFIPALKEAIRLSGIPISTKCLAPVADWGEEHIRKVQDILRRAGQGRADQTLKTAKGDILSLVRANLDHHHFKKELMSAHTSKLKNTKKTAKHKKGSFIASAIR